MRAEGLSSPSRVLSLSAPHITPFLLRPFISTGANAQQHAHRVTCLFVFHVPLRRHWMSGGCPRGDDCWFIHDPVGSQLAWCLTHTCGGALVKRSSHYHTLNLRP